MECTYLIRDIMCVGTGLRYKEYVAIFIMELCASLKILLNHGHIVWRCTSFVCLYMNTSRE